MVCATEAIEAQVAKIMERQCDHANINNLSETIL